VLVGAGQVVRRDAPGEDPATLAAAAVRAALDDSGAGEWPQAATPSVRCVAALSWLYRDLAALVAERAGIAPRETVMSAPVGGDGPQRLVTETAGEIAAGRLDVAVLAGAEALASSARGRTDGWPTQPEGVAPDRVIGTTRTPITDDERAVGLVAPVNVYALFERSDPAAIGDLWSGFSRVAAANPYAWLPEERSAAAIATPGPGNRRASPPYLKLMTANIGVDLAAAVVLCSAEVAQAAGVPRDRWVFVHAGGHAEEEWFVSQRRDLDAAPALGHVTRAALGHAGVDEPEHVDLYSCFPSAVQIAAREIGLSLDRPLTVTGGLTFAGGPGNDYAMHSIAALAGRLRSDPKAFGLATAVGWYLSKHAVGVYSARPPRRPFRAFAGAPLPEPRRALDGGAGELEAWTVVYARDGEPEAAIATALTAEGDRVIGRSEDPGVMASLLDGDPRGRPVAVDGLRLGDH
jgi:acetyl-CoA C-acetyltransferase